jgi:PAS domain S-box-containing protein
MKNLPNKTFLSYQNINDQPPLTDNFLADKEPSLLALIARETINAVIITDLQGRITWVNDAFTKTTGYTFDEVIGQLPGPLLSCPEKNRETKRYLDEKIKNREPFRVEIENRKKCGGTFWWEVYYQPLFDDQGNIVRFFSLNTDITEKKILQQQLDKERDEFAKKITAAAIQAQEMERGHVSRELHDNVNQVLTTIKLYTELCTSGIVEAAEILPKCTALLDSTIQEIQNLSRRLSPPTIANSNLLETLAQLIDNVEATQIVQIRFNHMNLQVPKIEKELHLAIYRIAQEHLTNILKHAEASEVIVSLEHKADELTLCIQDNGKGFNTQKRYSGIGITNMMSRAEILDGHVKIESSVGHGCTLTATFPVKVVNGNFLQMHKPSADQNGPKG